MTEPILAVRDLTVRFATRRGIASVVNGVSWEVAAGETLAIVGESGSGKSVGTLALTGLVPQPPARIGTVVLDFAVTSFTPSRSDRRVASRPEDSGGRRERAGGVSDPARSWKPVPAAVTGVAVQHQILLMSMSPLPCGEVVHRPVS